MVIPLVVSLQSTHALIRTLLASVLLASLAACGGGGGGSDNDDSSSGTPAASINPASIPFSKSLSLDGKITTVFPTTWEHAGSPEEPEVLASYSEPFQNATDLVKETVFLVKVATVSDISGGDLSNIRSISGRSLNVAGLPAAEEIFDATLAGSEELSLRFMQIHFTFDGAVFAFLYVAERDQFQRNVEIVRYIADHVRVGNRIISDLNTDSNLLNPGKPSIASDGQSFLVVSCRTDKEFPYNAELVGRILHSDRTMGAEFQIQPHVESSCRGVSHELIFDGQNYLLTYVAEIEHREHVVGQRISAQGTVLDAVPYDISRNSTSNAAEPDSSFDGTRTFVVWNERDSQLNQVRGTSVSPDMGLSEIIIVETDVSSQYPTAKSRVSPEIAYGNAQFLVVWGPDMELRLPDDGMPIFAQTLDAAGNAQFSHAFLIRSDDGLNHPRYVETAFNGNDYAVSWIEGNLRDEYGMPATYSVNARRVSPAGELLNGNAQDPGTVIGPPQPRTKMLGEAKKDFLKVRFANGSFYFLWSVTDPWDEGGIYAVKASPDLSNISPATPVGGTSGDRALSVVNIYQTAQPDVAFGLSNSFVVWPQRDGILEGWLIDEAGFDR